jgi:hypothetical protein
MRYLLLLLLIGMLLLPATPVFSDTGVGISIPMTTTVIDVLQVLDAQSGNVLPTGYVIPNISLGRGVSITKSLWVRNNSTTIDYVITPVYALSLAGIVSVSTEGAKMVAKGQTVKFDFVITGVTQGTSCSVALSFKRNQ